MRRIKRDQVAKNANSGAHTLSLFLSCSMSLILISLFIMMDADKFDNSRANLSTPEIRDEIAAEVTSEIEGSEIDGINTDKAKKKLSCYLVTTSSEELKEIGLSENSLEQLKIALKFGSKELPADLIEFVKKREECGYVSTKIEVILSLSKEAKGDDYEKIVDTYLAFNKELERISQGVKLEVIIENV